MPRQYRYGTWHGGGDPLQPPFDVRESVDEVGRDVMDGASVREAIDRLLRRGASGRSGLDELRRRLRERRDELRRRGNVAGTLDRVRAALDQALAAEREELARHDDTEAELARMTLDDLSDDVASAVQDLSSYEWRSPEAAATYEQIRGMLRREVLDAQFAGMRSALSGADPQSIDRVRDMIADLNALLAKHARGEDTTVDFREFMDKHGEFFPEQPRDTDDLIDMLARRQAAADRLLRSLTPEQRAELEQLMRDSLGDDVGLESELRQLQDNLGALRPGMMRDPGTDQIGGETPLGYGDAVGAVADLADIERLEAQLGQDYPGATLDDVDVDALERQLPPSAARDLDALRDLERELERQGYLTRDADGPSLTPKAMRRLGESALRRIFGRLQAAGVGHHDDVRSGSADEPTGASLPWEFGDERPIDAVRTLHNAALRTAASGSRSGGGVALAPDDFAVAETERRTQAAVALCVDLSFSMVQEGRWAPMKQTAIALSHLVETRFRSDALQVIGFARTARTLTPAELAEVEPSWEQGTNLQHALTIARRHVARYPEAEPVVLVITDGEPTAHLESDGYPAFAWPTTAETVRATIAEVDAMTRLGAALNFFLLGDDPGLARFVDAVARRNGGRVFTPELGRLGEYVVSDYLRTRR
ncbi:VWA domain-containing protein [Nocardioidaceae bacterium SCSIO 66511]|nr:VWA domain-containing protein [Nocardioidaceae bacterium SCSIO 66511]